MRRLNSLDGKTIGFISNDMWQAHRVADVARLVGRAISDGNAVSRSEFPMGNTLMDTEEAVTRSKRAGSTPL